MNKYEFCIVFKPNLEEEALKEELDKVVGYIQNLDGTIEKVDSWGKRRLAYEIQKTNEGFYYFITFSSEGETPTALEKRIRILETVLRYLIIRIDV